MWAWRAFDLGDAADLALFKEGAADVFTQEGKGEYEERYQADDLAYIARVAPTSYVLFEAASGTRAGYCTTELGTNTPYTPPGHSSWWVPFAWIGLMWVAPAFRRRGAARATYEYVIEDLKRRGVPELQLDVYDVNKSSIAFHEQMFAHYASVVCKQEAQWTTVAPAHVQWRELRPSDRGLVKRGMAAIDAGDQADRVYGITLSDAEEEQSVDEFYDTHAAHTRVACDAASGEVLGFCTVSVQTEHPFGVAYGPYLWPYLMLDCTCARARWV